MEGKITLLPGEELHTLIADELYILQRADQFRFGMDAVLLANWVKVSPKEKIIDLGTGSGIIPLLIAYKQRAERIIGIEIETEMVRLAKKSIKLNDLEQSIEIIQHDLRKIKDLFSPNTFSLVVSNPPYFPLVAGRTNLNPAKSLARHEIACTLHELVEVAAYLLGTGGRFSLIHRPERLPELFLQLLKCNLEPKLLCLIQPKAVKRPNLVLVEAVMDGRPGLKIQPNLVVYDQHGEYTLEILRFYQQGLSWAEKDLSRQRGWGDEK